MRLNCKPLFFLLFISFTSLALKSKGQEKILLSSAWSFYKGDLGGIWESVRVQQPGQPTSFPKWESVTLPHCFNSRDVVDNEPGYYQGPGWYRCFLSVKNPYPGGNTFLLFEGAGQKTEVYVGLNKAGSHVGGYDAWRVDITDALKAAGENEYIQENYNGLIPVSIRCDNSRDLEMIPSDLSDFFIYGGLYRPVFLEYQPANWFESVKIVATVDSAGRQGTVSVDLSGGNVSVNPDLMVTVLDRQGNCVVQKECDLKMALEGFRIASPDLWSPSSPSLYTIKFEIDFAGQKQVLADRFGFRFFEFKKQGPFYLNGERLLLKGTHRHEDFAGVGAAETEPMILEEMKLIKNMGANFIRLGHYQQSERVLELCDSLGLLVWEEIPWCRGGLGGESYQGQARNMLSNMITQHHNHPSVIVWGLGNENDWPGDFETFDKEAIRLFMKELHDLAHQLDPSRVTAIRRCDFCKDIVDVYSPSIWPGWYRGRFTDYEQVSAFENRQTNHFLHVEWGADSHAGRHAETTDSIWLQYLKPHDGKEGSSLSDLYSSGKNYSRESDWSETYAVELYDWILSQQGQMPWLTGTAFWVFKDFATPLRPENPIPYVNQKGVCERDLTRKETYYVVQSHWSNEPMVHIYGHSWPIRWGAAGALKWIKVYSNCKEVELFVNGKSAGKKKRNPQQYPAMGLAWEVPLKEGLNQVKAVGYNNNQIINDEVKWLYQVGTWGPVHKLMLEEEPGDSISSFLKVTAVDRAGKVCLDAAHLVEFEVIGAACILDNQGTSTGSVNIQLANGMARIRFRKTGLNYAASVSNEELGVFLLKNQPE